MKGFIETPRQLVARLESGELERAEFQEKMGLFQRELLEEIEEDVQNPFAAWLEARAARGVARKLLKDVSEYRVREVLGTLAEVPGYPPARYLWNAVHPDVPLHCFFRVRREPGFQVLEISERAGEVVVKVLREGEREEFQIKRDRFGRLLVPSFSRGGDKG